MSFGGGGFGSSGFGSNNNSNQSGSLFGGGGASGGSAFGSNSNNTGGFGSANTGGFGSNSNSGGGLFGGSSSTNNNNNTSGFGSGGFGSNTNSGGSLFGGNNNNNNNNRPAFGGGNTTGGGLFGNSTGSGGFGGSSGFGSAANNNNNNNNNTSSGFGSSSGGGGLFSNNTSSGFGTNNNSTSTGGGMFGGSSNNTSAFGGGGSGFGTGGSGFGSGASATQNSGTGSTPFQPFIENDGAATNVKAHYQSVSFQEPYKNFSFEELRQVDYDQGRKYGNQNGQAGAFGAASTFGGQTTGGGGFGSGTTGGFGSGGGGFGNANANNNNNTSGGFGSSTGAFGSNNSTGGGLFGSANKPAGTGLFGNSTTTTQQSGGGLFGTAGSNNTTGGFGSSNTTGGFGSANKPGGLFGGGSNTTGGFGSSSTTTGGGLFGGQSNQNNNQNTSSAFGGGGGFGSTTNNTVNQTQNTSGGLFGGGSAFGNSANNNNNQQKSIFGGGNATGGGSLFGNSQSNTNNTGGGGLFGQANQSNNTGGGLFGNKPATGGGLFGGGTPQNNQSGGGLFGQNTQQNNSSGGGLFGGQNKSLFGGSTTQNNNSTGGGSLFGGSLNNNNQQQSQGGLFGNATQSQNTGGSLFGNSQQPMQQSQQPQQLTASLMGTSPYGNEHLFASLGSTSQPIGPLATPLSASQKPRRPAPLPAYKLNPAASTRLITPQKKQSYGFSYSTYGTPGSAYGGSPLSGSLFSPSFSRTLTKSSSAGSLRGSIGGEDSILNVNAFSPGARSARSSGSMKKLQINRNIRTDLFEDSNVLRASPLKKAVSFDDNPAENTPTNGSTSTALVRVEDDSPSAQEMGFLRSSTSRSATNGSGTNGSQSATPEGDVAGKELATVPEHRRTGSREETPAAKPTQAGDQPLGDYWMQPNAKDIRRMSSQQIANIEQFTVGRMGAGKIEFHNVDLTNVPLDDVLAGIVRFAHRGVTVYADHDNKPPQGKGLNVPARVYLENSWPRSHGGRIRVYEKSGPKIEKHIERLSRIPNTQLVKFDTDNGAWIFDVEHFSTYELEDEDDTMMESMPGSIDDTASPLAMKRGGRRALAPEPSSSLGMEAPAQPDFSTMSRRSLPGGFDDEALIEAIHTSEMHVSNQPSFLDGAMHGGETQDMAFQEMTEVSKPSNAPNGKVGQLKLFTDSAVDQNDDHDADVDMDVEPESPRHTPTRDSTFQPRSILKSAMRPFSGTPARRQNLIDEDNWAGQLQRTISPKKQDRKILREKQDLRLQDMRPLEPTTTTDQGVVPFANSMDIMNSLFGAPKSASASATQANKANGANKDLQWPPPKRSKSQHSTTNDAEFDQAFHASFKPRWTPNGTLVTASHSLTNKLALTLRGSRTRLLPHSDEIGRRAVFKKPAITQSFEKQRSLSVVDIQDGVPRAHLPAKFSFADFANVAASEGGETNKDEQDVWQLAQILFDSQDPLSDEQAMRKQMLVQFWKSVVISSALTQAQRVSTPEEKAIACLSGFDIWGATEALLDGNDARLGLLVSQLDSEQRKGLRADVEQQINRWRAMKDLSEIPARIRALYEIVSGQVFVSEGMVDPLPENQAESFNISSKYGLDWRRAFGLRLWYGTVKQEPVGEAIKLYEEQLATGRDEPRPQPLFSKKNSDRSTLVEVGDGRQDVLYGLLKIFNGVGVDVAEILRPENVSEDGLDVMLSFQLFQTLSVRGVAGATNESTSLPDDLTEKLTAQLSTDSSTMCQALFAALHFSRAGPRGRAIKTLLERFAGDIPDSGDEFTYITQTLQVPEAWVWIAKAQHALAVLGSASLQASYLLQAGEAGTAHEVLTKVVAPLCVIEERISDLGRIVATFKASAAGKLSAWRNGGAIYGDFAELVEKSGGASAVAAGGRPRFAPGALADMHQICRRLRALVPRDEVWAQLGLEERAAYSEMERVVGVVEHEIEARRTGELGEGLARSGGEGEGRVEGVLDSVLAGAERASEVYYLRAQLAV